MVRVGSSLDKIPTNCHHSLSLARGYNKGWFSLFTLFVQRDQQLNITVFDRFRKSKERYPTPFPLSRCSFTLSTSSQPTRCFAFAWNGCFEFPFHLSLRSLTPQCSSAAPTLSWLQPSLSALGCWEQGIVIGAPSEPHFSSLSSTGSLALLCLFFPLPSFCVFLFFCVASVSRQCCAACRSMRQPCCRASPQPGGPLDAGWKRLPRILHEWPSGNSGNCSLLNLKRQER